MMVFFVNDDGFTSLHVIDLKRSVSILLASMMSVLSCLVTVRSPLYDSLQYAVYVLVSLHQMIV